MTLKLLAAIGAFYLANRLYRLAKLIISWRERVVKIEKDAVNQWNQMNYLRDEISKLRDEIKNGE